MQAYFHRRALVFCGSIFACPPFLSTPHVSAALAPMAVATDVQMILRQARDGRMARSKLIEVIVAREGAARRAETTAEAEKVIASQIEKGRILSETKNGVEILSLHHQKS